MLCFVQSDEKPSGGKNRTDRESFLFDRLLFSANKRETITGCNIWLVRSGCLLARNGVPS